MFMVLKKEVSVADLKDLSLINNALNLVFRAKELSADDKRTNLIILLIKYEVYLKKI